MISQSIQLNKGKKKKKSTMTTTTLEIYAMHCSTALSLADWFKTLLLDRKCTTRQLCVWVNHLRHIIVFNLKELQREVNS